MPALEGGGEPTVAAPFAGIVKCLHCGFASRGSGRETGALNLLEHRKTLLASIAAREGKPRGLWRAIAANVQ